MRLKRIVGIGIALFAFVVLYYWFTGIWFPGKPPSQIDQMKSDIQAAKSGLFDQPSPPIIHFKFVQ